VLIPQSELRGPVPRMRCPYCDKFRYWDIKSGLLATLMGRAIQVQCRTCGNFAMWDQS
jgi:endogenous inhibitor of DNA gyrase (YacG/DUF329 family)